MRIVALLLLLLWSGVARADESISRFDSDVQVDTNGVLTVTETITVNAEHFLIKHGIRRDFPTVRGQSSAGRYRVGFEIISAERDGAPEPWFTETTRDVVHVYVGDREKNVTDGSHVYRLTYRTSRQIGFFKDHDELYWNVTGNSWAFPIERVTATIRLPPSGTIKKTAAYTGFVGSTDEDASTSVTGNEATFVTKHRLVSGEGLTATVAWPKGLVTPPTLSERLEDALRANVGLIVVCGGVLAVLIFYLLTWWHYGRDPERGTIIPQYDPPKGMSAPACRYVLNQEWDEKNFSSALVDMCARGYTRMEEIQPNVFSLKKIDKAGSDVRLPLAERAVAKVLFAGGWNSVPLRSEYHTLIGNARDELQRALSAEHDHVHFVTNHTLLTIGAILSAFAGFAAVMFDQDNAASLVFGFLVGGVVLAIYRITRRGWRGLREAGAVLRVIFIIVVVGALHALPLLISAIAVAVATTKTLVSQSFISIEGLAGAMLVVINLIFFEIMKAPTVLGRKLMDHIEGFRHYLTVAEKDRLNFHNPPELTPARFEAYLPYAIALDVENEWGEQFNRAMRQTEVAERSVWNDLDYTPSWYDGRRGSWSSGSWSELSSALVTNISTASTPPNSVSGLRLDDAVGELLGGKGGGGGFSGGGGGGGGGSGW